MGQMRFLVPRPERISEALLQRAYLAGMDCIPWLSETHWDGSELIVVREIRESGNLYVPWPVVGQGELILCTASLMERKQPYHLPVELARGTLNRLRNQAAAWQMVGMDLSPDYRAKLRQSQLFFARAANEQAEPLAAADDAERALQVALEAINILSGDYVRQVLTMRHQQTPQLPTLLAGNVESEPLTGQFAKRFRDAFNSAAVPLNWRDMEREQGQLAWDASDQQMAWCCEQGLRIIAGPLMRLDSAGIPDWLYLWEGDIDMLRSFFTRRAEDLVQRYLGKVNVWHVAARMNVMDTLKLSEEQRLRLTVDVIDAVRRHDPKTPMIVSFDQPWAEFLAREDLELSPLHFADTLVRADLGVGGLGLEINLGYWPGGTLPRDLLEFGRQIDQWSILGLPLVIFLTAPSDAGPDPLALLAAKPIAAAADEGLSRESQRELVEHLVPLLLAKQAVQGIVWNQLRDDQPHNFPHGGLFDTRQKRKPAIKVLTAIRKAHLV